MKLIIDIDKEIYESSKRECEESDDLIIDTFTLAIGYGTPIPDNATNGDVVKKVFGNVPFYHDEWWNAPYQKGE